MKKTIKKPVINQSNFLESINAAIQECRHVDYLKNVLDDYADYKKTFDEAFTDQNSPDMVYTFHVTYLRKESIWREIAILGKQKFEKLAIAIVEAMGWENDHMHGFSLPKTQQSKNYPAAIPYTFYAYDWDDDPHPTFKSDEVLICNMDYGKYPQLDFEFDYGDSHTFEILFKGMRKPENKETTKTLPKLIDQRGVAPKQYPY